MSDQERHRFRSLRVVPHRRGYVWSCRLCHPGQVGGECETRSEGVSAFLLHVNGPEHRTAVSCEAAARRAVTLVLAAQSARDCSVSS